MGTNYYLKLKDRMHLIHIGKSSCGWAFALHYIPGMCENLAQWKDYINNKENIIFDEYDNEVSIKDLMNVITKRGTKSESKRNYSPNVDHLTSKEMEEFSRINHAWYDRKLKLWRHKDRYTKYNTEDETYDLIEGEFC